MWPAIFSKKGNPHYLQGVLAHTQNINLCIKTHKCLVPISNKLKPTLPTAQKKVQCKHAMLTKKKNNSKYLENINQTSPTTLNCHPSRLNGQDGIFMQRASEKNLNEIGDEPRDEKQEAQRDNYSCCKRHDRTPSRSRPIQIYGNKYTQWDQGSMRIKRAERTLKNRE